MSESIVLINAVQRFLTSIDELQVIPEAWQQMQKDIERSQRNLDSAVLAINSEQERIRELEAKIERACEALGC